MPKETFQPNRPLIGVPTAELPGFTPHEPSLWAMRTSYIEPVLRLGGLPVLLPQISHLGMLRPILDQLDGLLLAGGHDPHPELYGATPSRWLERTDAARDRSEFLITQWALTTGLPILGICRGMQMVNLAAGGTLIQDISERFGPAAHNHRDNPPRYDALQDFGHPITIAPGSRLKTIVRRSPTWMNSMHHQCVDRLGAGLVVVARSDDGVIEGLETRDPGHWFIGLQGHPEALASRAPWVTTLFGNFVAAAQKYQTARSANSSVSSQPAVASVEV